MADKKTKQPPPVYLCGVPNEQRKGVLTTTNGGLRTKSATRCHADSESAFNCKKKYLVSLGYVEVGQRELRAPEHLGGAVEVLPKKSRFGGKLRAGKGGTRYQPRGVRAGIVF